MKAPGLLILTQRMQVRGKVVSGDKYVEIVLVQDGARTGRVASVNLAEALLLVNANAGRCGKAAGMLVTEQL
jgi:hypothetical protein